MQEIAMKGMKNGASKEEIARQKEEAKFNLNNMLGIVARQYSTGIYRQASNIYVQRVKDRRDLDTEYARLTGQKRVMRKNEEFVDLNMNNLIKEFKNSM